LFYFQQTGWENVTVEEFLRPTELPEDYPSRLAWESLEKELAHTEAARDALVDEKVCPAFYCFFDYYFIFHFICPVIS
jgi:hypothetical protein